MTRDSLGRQGPIVFEEDRVDHRIAVSSSGDSDVLATLTRGSSRGDRDVVRATGLLNASGRALEGRLLHEEWLRELQTLVTRIGARVASGSTQASWTAKLVAFRQQVWVESPSGLSQDIREGCRLELRASVGGAREGFAVEDLVLPGRDASGLDPCFERVLERAATRRSLGAPPAPGATTVVFAPGVAGIVAHELIGHALEGDVVQRKRSWLAHGKLPTSLRPMTVIDDPRRGRGAWAIDDEGTPSRETVLIEGGRHVGALLDRATAEALGRTSTGHARRSSFLDPALPRMGCTFIEAGSDDPEETVLTTSAGLFIRRLATGHTDPLTGRAWFLVTDADRIVDGRLVEPVDAFILEIDGAEAWSSIDRVGHDLAFDRCVGSCVRDGQPLAVSVGAPTIRIGVVRVRC